MSTPIFAGEKKTGVLIFQIPLKRMNAIMAQNYQWKDNGLGKTGETFLVGLRQSDAQPKPITHRIPYLLSTITF